MRFSRDWLADYVELPGDAAEAAERLTAVGLAVETVEPAGDDRLFDVDVTTNRPDCMNHLGLARELAVALGRPLTPPGPLAGEPIAEASEPATGAAAVTLEDPEGCPRYAARVIRGVRVGPSPAWLARRLEAIGLRPINNVVDVTNFVLWETGQPLHAFDLATLGGDPLPEIRVRRARPGELLTTLDGVERTLDPQILVIADADRAVALAGVMGGLATEVTPDTTAVLLESAHFDPRAVRETARRLGMHTDASHRFERGADPEAPAAAAARAAALIAEVAGGEVLAGAIDVRAERPPAGRSWPSRGTLRLADLEAFAGVEIAAADVERWLGGLGFGLEPASAPGGEAWEVTVPSWRWYDVEPGPDGAVYPADFYEEVLRHLGFDEVPSALPLVAGSDGPRTAEQRRRDRIRDRLAAAGYAEAINYAFQAGEADAAVPVALHRAAGLPEGVAAAPPLGLANPLSERYAVLRRSLVPNLVDTARFNRRRGADAVRLFEIGHLFFDLAPVAATGRDGLPVEEVEAVALVAGGAVGTPWNRRFELDLFDLKGAAEELVASLGGELVTRPAELAGVVPGTGAELSVRDAGAAADDEPRPAGWMGRVDDPAEDPAPLYAVELATAALGGERGPVPVDPPSKLPGIEADLTLTHPLAVRWADIEAAVEAHRPADLAAFGLKDRYAGKGVPDGAVNSTMGFHYVSPERSLTQDEVNERQRRLAAELERRFGLAEEAAR